MRRAQRRKVFEQEAVDEDVGATDLLQKDEPRGVIEKTNEGARNDAAADEQQAQHIMLDDVESAEPQTGK